MTDITFRSDMRVDTIQVQATDKMVAQAAWVSTNNDVRLAAENKDIEGLLGYLARKRHGSPFEHNLFTFRIEAHIAVAREAFRHRIASYNEVSGRYTVLEPVFYIHPEERNLVQSGSGAHPKLTPGTPEQFSLVQETDREAAQFAWDLYEKRLAGGLANEVARTVLPLSTYTSWYVSMNARALMNFLSLRVDAEGALFETKPLYEIELVARQMEETFKEAMPITWAAWIKAKRVAP